MFMYLLLSSTFCFCGFMLYPEVLIRIYGACFASNALFYMVKVCNQIYGFCRLMDTWACWDHKLVFSCELRNYGERTFLVY
jgi:hypothetical protein